MGEKNPLQQYGEGEEEEDGWREREKGERKKVDQILLFLLLINKLLYDIKNTKQN